MTTRSRTALVWGLLFPVVIVAASGGGVALWLHNRQAADVETDTGPELALHVDGGLYVLDAPPELDGTKAWAVFPPVAGLATDSTNRRAFFAPPPNSRHTVLCAALDDGEITFLTRDIPPDAPGPPVPEPGPVPGPGPNPAPNTPPGPHTPVPAGKRVIVILHETEDRSAAFARLITEVRAGETAKWLDARGHLLYFLDDDSVDKDGQPTIAANWQRNFPSLTGTIVAIAEAPTTPGGRANYLAAISLDAGPQATVPNMVAAIQAFILANGG